MKRKCPPDEQPFEGGENVAVVTPRSSLLRKSVRVDGVTVVLQAMSNAGRTAQLKRVVSVTNKYTSRCIRRTRMQNVVCCEHTRVRCVPITWARCTRVAAVKAPEDRVHRSD
jgi:hypothetical protein